MRSVFYRFILIHLDEENKYVEQNELEKKQTTTTNNNNNNNNNTIL